MTHPPHRLLACLIALALLGVSSCGPTGEGDPGSVLLPDGTVIANALGPIDPESTGAVLEFMFLPLDEHVAASSPAWQAGRDKVLALGIRAIPELAKQLRRGGCDQQAAVSMMGLLQELSDAVGFEAARSIGLSDLALELAARTGDVPTPPSSELEAARAAGGGAAEIAAAVEGGSSEAILRAAAQRGITRRCAGDALDLVRFLRAKERIAPADLETLTRKHLETLPDGSVLAVDMFGLLDASAPSEKADADAFELLAQDPRYEPVARGVACEAAIRRNNRMKGSLGVIDTLTPPVLVCLLEGGAGREWFDHLAARKLLDHPDRVVRLAAIASLVEESAGADFDLLLGRLHELRQSPRRLRESTALLRAVTDIVRLNPEIRERALASIQDPDLRAEVETDDVHLESRAHPERFARDQCDTVVEAGADAAAINAELTAGGAGVSVCLRDGSYAGSVTLDQRGQRLIALTGGGATVTGDLFVLAPIVVVGVSLGGGLVLAPDADGSVILGVRATGRSTLLSERSLLAGFGSEGGAVALMPGLDGPSFVPGTAPELAIRVGKTDLEKHGSRGGALGWVDSVHLVPAAGTNWSVSLDAATLQRWFAPGLARYRPDRVPMEADGRWVPLYGSADPTSSEPALAVPLGPAPWRLRYADLVVLAR